jgi:hypothetical protein
MNAAPASTYQYGAGHPILPELYSAIVCGSRLYVAEENTWVEAGEGIRTLGPRFTRAVL